jgi:alpha-ketoglutarate-dependent taurine dioxygenase
MTGGASAAPTLWGDGRTSVAIFQSDPTHDADSSEWVDAVAEDVRDALLTHGAALLRGFGVRSADKFRIVAEAIGGELYAHNHEHEPVSEDGAVQTPVFYPADRKLLWHNENSYNREWPLRLLFCCVTAPTQGGETPLVDSRLVLRNLDRSIVERFTERGVRYLRSYGEGLGLDWRTVFATDDPRKVERQCAAEDLEYSWTAEGTLRTAAVRPAVVHHPVTGELAWFNQAQHWHPSCLDPETREALLSLYAEEDLPRNCQYGDGSPIEDSVMAEVLDVYEQVECVFPWQEGDVLAIDNVLVAHARNPYTGPRRLFVALAGMYGFDAAREG